MGQKKPKTFDFEIIPAPDSKEATEMIQENSPAFSSPVGNPTLNKSDRKTSCLKQKPKSSEKKSEPKRRSIKRLNYSSSPENKKRVRLCILEKSPADIRDDLIDLEQIETSENF